VAQLLIARGSDQSFLRDTTNIWFASSLQYPALEMIDVLLSYHFYSSTVDGTAFYLTSAFER
jgi:hypothetical protein